MAVSASAYEQVCITYSSNYTEHLYTQSYYIHRAFILHRAFLFSRDLGSSFPVLRVLWMARCNLEDLDGVTAMNSLKELYLAYNDITDLSPLSMMDGLEVIDLEG